MITLYRNFLRWIAEKQTDEEILKSAHYNAFVLAMIDLAKISKEEMNSGKASS